MTAVLIIIFLGIAAWAMNSPIKKQEIIEAKRETQRKLYQESRIADWERLRKEHLDNDTPTDG